MVQNLQFYEKSELKNSLISINLSYNINYVRISMHTFGSHMLKI